MGVVLRPLFWLPSWLARDIYTVVFKPKLLRALAHAAIKRMIPARLNVKGVTLALNRDDAVLCGALALGCYGWYELDFFERMLRPGFSVLDIGANIGLYSAVSAGAVGPAGTVFAIEPDRCNCDFLRRTIGLNGFTNVHITQAAASDSTCPGRLFLSSDNKADHRIFDSADGREHVPVDLTTIDDFVAARGIARVDVVKMDIQGAEPRAFAGMRRTLEANRDVRVVMEFWPWGIVQGGGDARGLLADIRAMGFRIYELDDRVRRAVEVTDDEALAGRNLERQHTNILVQRAAEELFVEGLSHREDRRAVLRS